MRREVGARRAPGPGREMGRVGRRARTGTFAGLRHRFAAAAVTVLAGDRIYGTGGRHDARNRAAARGLAAGPGAPGGRGRCPAGAGRRRPRRAVGHRHRERRRTRRPAGAAGRPHPAAGRRGHARPAHRVPHRPAAPGPPPAPAPPGPWPAPPRPPSATPRCPGTGSARSCGCARPRTPRSSSTCTRTPRPGATSPSAASTRAARPPCTAASPRPRAGGAWPNRRT